MSGSLGGVEGHEVGPVPASEAAPATMASAPKAAVTVMLAAPSTRASQRSQPREQKEGPSKTTAGNGGHPRTLRVQLLRRVPVHAPPAGTYAVNATCPLPEVVDAEVSAQAQETFQYAPGSLTVAVPAAPKFTG